MSRFEFATATRIVFGSGTLPEAAPLAAGFGSRAFVVTGHDISRATALLEYLSSVGMEITIFSVTGEPTTSDALEGAKKARKARSDVVVSFIYDCEHRPGCLNPANGTICFASS